MSYEPKKDLLCHFLIANSTAARASNSGSARRSISPGLGHTFDFKRGSYHLLAWLSAWKGNDWLAPTSIMLCHHITEKLFC